MDYVIENFKINPELDQQYNSRFKEKLQALFKEVHVLEVLEDKKIYLEKEFLMLGNNEGMDKKLGKDYLILMHDITGLSVGRLFSSSFYYAVLYEELDEKKTLIYLDNVFEEQPDLNVLHYRKFNHYQAYVSLSFKELVSFIKKNFPQFLK